jgi:putative SOS response-associated peptidase YedK
MTGIHDRMPVILHKDDETQWLAADKREDIEPLLTPYDDARLNMFEVSKDVNVTKANDKTLILPINSA